MIELVFTACLIATPDACEQRSLTFLAHPSPVACMVQAPPELAAWADRHPAYARDGLALRVPGKPLRARLSVAGRQHSARFAAAAIASLHRSMASVNLSIRPYG